MSSVLPQVVSSSPEDDDREIAAGAILTREANGSFEICLVRRKQYGDWVLPGGRPKPGEGMEAAAEREAREETGHDVTRGDFAGSVTYQKEKRWKSRLFWLMTPMGSAGQPKGDEIVEVCWLPLAMAVEKLSHPGEKDLVRGVVSRGASLAESQVLELGFPWRLSHRHTRLAARLASYRSAVQNRHRACLRESRDASWIADVEGCLRSAQRALRRREVEVGWQCLLEAQRLELRGYSDAEIKAHLDALAAEADDKIAAWRGPAIVSMIKAVREKSGAEQRAVALQVTLIRDENGNNTYTRLRLLQTQLTVLGVFLAALIASLLLIVKTEDQLVDGVTFQLLRHVVVFGALGAIVSSMRPLRAAGVKIPEVLRTWIVAVARIPLGAALAIVAIVMLQSKLIQFGVAGADPSTATLLSLAFVAGFSERLVMQAAARLARDGDKKKKDGE